MRICLFAFDIWDKKMLCIHVGAVSPHVLDMSFGAHVVLLGPIHISHIFRAHKCYFKCRTKCGSYTQIGGIVRRADFSRCIGTASIWK